MNYEQFHSVKAGDLVYWPENAESDNEPFGWTDDMDDMIGEPVFVSRRVSHHGVDGIRVEHPESGASYTFRADYLQLLEPAPKKKDAHFVYGEYCYTQPEALNEERLRDILLGEDFLLFMAAFKLKPNEFFQVTKDSYIRMKSVCPRAIGALIGCGYLQKDIK